MGTAFSAILTGLHFSTSGIGSLITVAQTAPKMIDAAEEIAGTASEFMPVAQTLHDDLSAIVKVAEAGQWKDEAAAIAKLTGDIQTAWSKSKLTASKIASAAQRLAPHKAVA